MSHASIDAETRKSRNMPEDLIRLCVGIENVTDLIRDLQNAVPIRLSTAVTLDDGCWCYLWGASQKTESIVLKPGDLILETF
jgi:hypothetical protein